MSTDTGSMTVVEKYEIYMQGSGFSDRWIPDSLWILGYFARLGGVELTSARAIDVSRFLGRPHLSPASRYTYYGYLHSFYKWFAANGGHNPMAELRRPRMPRSVPRGVSDDQLVRLLEVRMRLRTLAMVMLAAYAGLRVHEIAKFRGEDINLHDRTIHVTGKGGHSATLPMHPKLVEIAERMPSAGWWFPANSRGNGHVLPRSVSDIIKNAMVRAKVPGSAHSLRHWFGTTLVHSGADLRTAQTLLRHASLATTERYTAVSDSRRTDAVLRLNPYGDSLT
ncbi:tyrosine-type recombinase/integrase [Rhodococcus erythropolis]|uniref:tyrosine-type recombinase/integrase n=1 Tax=Rhodococcus erythropolis TaxID=1833 RepID=UPI00339E8FA9